MSKSPPRVARLADASFTPRFEYGDEAQVAQVIRNGLAILGVEAVEEM